MDPSIYDLPSDVARTDTPASKSAQAAGNGSDPSHASTAVSSPARNLDDPKLFINRELSWLQFNWRVFEEAMDMSHPLLERVKFLAIFANNLDEFFMVRVSGLRRQLAARIVELSSDGMTPAEQLAAIRQTVEVMYERQANCWYDDLLPKLNGRGIRVLHDHELSPAQRHRLKHYFQEEIYPVLTPLAFDPGHPFPHISNLSLNLAVVVNDPERGERFARLKVPDTFPRLVPIPKDDESDVTATADFIWLEDLIAANLDGLFPGLDVVDTFSFRITRDADFEIVEDDAEDLLTTIEESVDQRTFGPEVRLELDIATPDRIRKILVENLEIEEMQVYTVKGLIGMSDLMQLMKLERPELKDTPFVPSLPLPLSDDGNIFDAVRSQDVLFYHPYNSFTPVVDFVREAARDPQVLAIKLTLYRVGPKSPIVDALMEARENGKQVAVLVELKARFDEENNIAWARALEQAGVHVVYGVIGLKTHAKMCLVVRREDDGIRRYVHMSTGNYNTSTSRVYTDLGLLTADEEFGEEMTDLFNALTGYSRKETYGKLLVAPGKMRKELIARIEREIAVHQAQGGGYLAFKMNALVDRRCIQALYRASQAGVRIDLQVRGICCLRPGIPGVSETITVTSIVGRFLEHVRIYYFANGGSDEILTGSADLMPRNLERRIEVLFPVQDPALKSLVLNTILRTHLGDNVKARRLLPDGSYRRVTPAAEDTPLDSQAWMLEHFRALGPSS
ncbi:MAG TPA: polyphosphate kinase 1 [bacterium]